MKEIALRLGRAQCTLYRELRRNRFSDDELPELDGYYGMNAQDMYARRRAIHRKLVKDATLKAAVLDRLEAGWSPEKIAGRMTFERHPVRVSHETIYLKSPEADPAAEAVKRFCIVMGERFARR